MNGPGSQSARLRPFRPMAFGRYTLLSPLATGGMGEIYLARIEGMSGFEKLCVIKKILSALAQDPVFVERFVGEAKTLVKLSHGSIAQVLDMGLHDDEPYIALEFVDGKDLRKVAARQRDRSIPLPLTFVLFVMSRVLDALAYAHRKRDDNEKEINLVHRDISPQNILISYEGEVKVIDFGLAKSALSSAKTNPSMILGKFLYMSPEQARHQKVDRRSDLYSVGVCLYELISGRNPFDGVSPGDLMSHVANPVFPSLQEVDPLCPQSVVDVVMRALSADPARRFQTAEEMRGKLLSALLEIDPSAGPESVSRYMREAFASEYQGERKLLSMLNQAKTIKLSNEDQQQAKPADVETAVVHLKDVAPSVAAAMNLSAPGEARAPLPTGPIEPAPLSFAPTPRAHDVKAERPEGETVPGISLDETTRPGAQAPSAKSWQAPAPMFDDVPKVTPSRTPVLETTNPALAIPPVRSTVRPNPGLPPTVEVSPEAELLQPGDTARPIGDQQALKTSDTQPRVVVPDNTSEETVPRVLLGTLLEDDAKDAPVDTADAQARKEDTQPRSRAFVGRRATVDVLAMQGSSEAVTGPTAIPPGPPVLKREKQKSNGLKYTLVGVLLLLMMVGAALVLLPMLAGPDGLPFALPWADQASPGREKPVDRAPREGPPRGDEPVVAPAAVEARARDAGHSAGSWDDDEIDIVGLTEESPPPSPRAPVKPVVKESPVKKSVRKPSTRKARQLASEFRQLSAQLEFVQRRVPCETRAMSMTCTRFDALKQDVEDATSDAEADRLLRRVRDLSSRVAQQRRKLGR